MNNEELKKKIADIVLGVEWTGCLGNTYHISGGMSVANAIADALIAAGIGDISAWKHRAEVAERALRRKCESEADSTCPCDENSDKCKVCAEKRLCSTEYATQCYYEMAIHQAEREIKEEERK